MVLTKLSYDMNKGAVMKTLFKYISFACLSAIMLFAETESVTQTKISVLVDKIKSAKPEDKRALINELKIELRTMNKETRQKTMMELKNSFAKGGMHQQMRNHKNSSMHSQDKNQNMQQAGQRGKHQGMQNGGQHKKGH